MPKIAAHGSRGLVHGNNVRQLNQHYQWNLLNPLLFMSKAVLPTHFSFISVPFFTAFINILLICNNIFLDFSRGFSHSLPWPIPWLTLDVSTNIVSINHHQLPSASIVGIIGVHNVSSVTDGKASIRYQRPSVPDANLGIVSYHLRVQLVT